MVIINITQTELFVLSVTNNQEKQNRLPNIFDYAFVNKISIYLGDKLISLSTY